jgi:hypothetical protein
VIGEFSRENRLNLVANLADKCVNVLNEEKTSLGIVKPIIQKCYLSEQEDFDTSQQLNLLGLPLPKVKDQFAYIPRIQYNCSQCMAKNIHDQQVIEWGFYEWIRKNPDKANQVWENALLNSPKHEKFFLVGNLFRYRNIFLIVSVLRLPKGNVSKPLLQPIKVST